MNLNESVFSNLELFVNHIDLFFKTEIEIIRKDDNGNIIYHHKNY